MDIDEIINNEINSFMKKQSINEKTYKVYHGTNNKFNIFDFNRATQGIIWFTDNVEKIKNGEHGGMGNKYVMTRYITLNNPAGWNEYEKYGLGQIEEMGYDGIILPDGDSADYVVFNSKSIKADVNEENYSSYDNSSSSPLPSYGDRLNSIS